MNKRRRRTKKQTRVKKDPRDVKAERIIYAVLIIFAIISVVIGFKMSQEVAAEENVQTENSSKEIEK